MTENTGSNPDPFHRDERRALEAAVASGSSVSCPRCGSVMDARPVDPGPAISYVRHRVLLVCTGCHRAASVDVEST
jgi:hypothetical protein